MAVDNRPFKSKEQDGQGNEVIIRDQQLVEQGTATTMASGACFETRDVDDRPVKIPRDNMMNIVLECIGIILNDSSRNLGTNVQKALGLQGNTVGHSTVADFASVLGAYYNLISDNGLYTADLNSIDTNMIVFCTQSAVPTNAPANEDFICISLFVSEGISKRRGIQRVFTKTGTAYYRFYDASISSGSKWSSWFTK